MWLERLRVGLVGSWRRLRVVKGQRQRSLARQQNQLLSVSHEHQHVLELIVGVQEIQGFVLDGDFPAQQQLLHGVPKVGRYRHELEVCMRRPGQFAQENVPRQVVRHQVDGLFDVFRCGGDRKHF